MLIRRKSTSVDNSVYPSKEDRSWDNRTWVAALGAMAAQTVLAALSSYPIASYLLNEKMHVAFWTTNADDLVILGVFAVTLIMPMVLTVMARRVPFLWGAFPFVAVETYTAMYDILYRHELWPTTRDINQLILVPLWFVLSGIGLIIRAVIRRRRRRIETPAAISSGDREAWPPTPKQGDEGSITSPPA